MAKQKQRRQNNKLSEKDRLDIQTKKFIEEVIRRAKRNKTLKISDPEYIETQEAVLETGNADRD
jgi:hypothetical protein